MNESYNDCLLLLLFTSNTGPTFGSSSTPEALPAFALAFPASGTATAATASTVPEQDEDDQEGDYAGNDADDQAVLGAALRRRRVRCRHLFRCCVIRWWNWILTDHLTDQEGQKPEEQ